MKVAFLHNGYESLAIEALSAALKKAGVETSLVIDPQLFNEPGFWRIKPLARAFDLRRGAMRRLEADKPDLVCFSVFTDTYQWALSWAEEVKRVLGVPVVFGGIHPTSVPERVIAKDCVDFVCVGEGDRALSELAAALASGREPSVPNIWRKKNGAVLKGPLAAPEDPDSLEFPDKEIFYGRYPFFNHGYLAAASRGCPFSCAYCANNVYSRLYGAGYARKRSPGRVIEELSLAKSRWRPGFIHFVDEVFNWDKAWLEEFLPRYKQEVGLPFSCYIYPDLLEPGSAAMLKEAGCFKVQLGVQTFDGRRRMEMLKRPSDNKKIARAIEALKSAGIYTVCDSILDLPGDTEKDLAELSDFYARHTPDQNEVFFLKNYPATELTLRAEREGLLTPGEAEDLKEGRGKSGIMSGRGGPLLERFSTVLTMLPLLPGFLRKSFAASGFAWRLAPRGLALRFLARLLRRPRRDFNTGRFLRLYAHFIFAKLRGDE